MINPFIEISGRKIEQDYPTKYMIKWEIMLTHTWYNRSYGENDKHTKRINTVLKSIEPFRIKFSDQDATRFDYLKRMGFTITQWKEIKVRFEKSGLEFMSSPFRNAAEDLLKKIKY